jgi:hypothetical protein
VQVVGRQSFFEAMRSFLLQHFFSDADMAAEMHAGSGAAHYDMDEYTVSGRSPALPTVTAAVPPRPCFTGYWCQHTSKHSCSVCAGLGCCHHGLYACSGPIMLEYLTCNQSNP